MGHLGARACTGWAGGVTRSVKNFFITKYTLNIKNDQTNQNSKNSGRKKHIQQNKYMEKMNWRHRQTRGLTCFQVISFWKYISRNRFLEIHQGLRINHRGLKTKDQGQGSRIKDQGPCLGTNEHLRRAVDVILSQIEDPIEIFNSR